MRRLPLSTLLACLCASVLAAAALAAPNPIELRDRGLALLENEQPGEAETVFRELVRLVPGDPLAPANLAVALLRQQKLDEARTSAESALAVAPNDPAVLAVHAEVLRWAGDAPAALAAAARAVAAAPDVPRLHFLLLDLAAMAPGPTGEEAADAALTALARLRPDNLYVLLRAGRRALERDERAAASRRFLRVRELVAQAPPIAETTLGAVLAALSDGELERARTQALRLENVLKITPGYRQSLAELTIGVQGTPLARFASEPPRTAFGAPVAVRFAGRALDARPTLGRALVAADFDGDQRIDLARLRGDGAGCLEIRLAARRLAAADCLPAANAVELEGLDLDNDGALDLLAYGPTVLHHFRGRGDGGFQAAGAESGLAAGGAAALAALDADLDGDLDLVVAGGRAGWELYRNALAGPLEAVGDRTLRGAPEGAVRDLRASDLDRDGALDLVAVTAGGVVWLRNRWQGELAGEAAPLAAAAGAEAVLAADLGQDGMPELVLAGEQGIALLTRRSGRYEAVARPLPEAARRPFRGLIAADFDNDGRLDLAAAGAGGIAALAQRDGTFASLAIAGAPAAAAALAAADLDGDGDLDLVVGGSEGLHLLTNEGGHRNRHLSVRLRGLVTGSSKNNLDGRGATIELFDGHAYQFREVTGPITHFGLGQLDAAEVLRVVWTNGVPQNRLAVAGNQTIVEEQVLKGSCPFLYAWTGERIEFVTDLLWGAPLGLPVAPGRWADSHPEELVRVEGAVPRDGRYELRVTEELWEAAHFDLARLWLVDVPDGVEIASNLRIVPGGAKLAPGWLASRAVRPLAAAWDGAGREVTALVARRDERYADGFRPSRYQGLAAEPWRFTFDLGEVPTEPVRLHLEGWTFPTDASLNLAIAQRDDLAPAAPRLEVETAEGWRPLVAALGFPPGKTKRMIVDLPPLPAGARRLRIVTNMWISWDRIAWSTAPADGEPRLVAQLAPERARLAFRGFSELARRAPNAPHHYDYSRLSRESPWLPLPGRYTRYGDVRELLFDADDRLVLLASGDELELAFDASHLPPPAPGWRREAMLESHGWDKDADRNTYAGTTLEPLPFRAMSGYPFAAGESYPDTPALREYRERWLTREIAPAPRGRPAEAGGASR
ncbi:MAG TPA: FG-GAP-like repeat-containing protein [Thermoanaerobaculia bacterium]